jgi:predicted glycosyltransferase
VFYSHSGAGVGDLQRQFDLAAAFKARHPDAAVLVVTGAHAAGMFSIPRDIDYVKLPSTGIVDGESREPEPRELPLGSDEVIWLRADLLERAVRVFVPDLLVADFLPAGPQGELLGALQALREWDGVAVAGFRDVIDEPTSVRELWQRTGVYGALRSYYQAICVYGDPTAVDFTDAYGFDTELTARTRYCGYLGRGPLVATDAPLYERPLVLANGEGGADSVEMLETFVDAGKLLRHEHGGTWLTVTGPLMDDADHDRLVRAGEAAGQMVRRAVPELRAHVALADCAVTRAGYTTCCDLLTFRRPAVLVPRNGRNQEQRIRAEQLRQWGSARVLDVSELSAELLASEIAAALSGDPPPPAPVSLDGLERAVDAFDEALAASRAVA